MIYRFGEYRLSVAARELRHRQRVVQLPSRVFDCLLYLIENRDRAIGRDEIVAAVWGRVDVSDAQLGQIVLRARRAVGDDGNEQRAIRTMQRFGYHWIAETVVEADAPSATAAIPQQGKAQSSEDAGPGDEVRVRTNRVRWRSPTLAAILLAAGLAIALLGTIYFDDDRSSLREAPIAGHTAASLVVLPMRVTAAADRAWLRLGAMDALANRLRAAGLPVPSSDAVLAARGDPVDDEATVVHELRETFGPALIVRGELANSAAGWRLDLVATPVAGDVMRVAVEAQEPLDAVRRGADRLAIRLGHQPPDEIGADSDVEETLERANAAMLANQLGIARAILGNAPALQREQPRLRYRLAQVDFRAGRLAEVETALQSLLDDESVAGDSELHARVLTGLGTVHLNWSRYAEAERDFEAAVAALDSRYRPLERGQALAGLGAARAAQGDYDAALSDLGKSRIALEQAGDVLGLARLDMVEGTLASKRGRSELAIPLLRRADEVFQRFDAVNERLHTLSTLTDEQLRVLDHAGALASSDLAWSLRARAADPQLRSQLVATRAELLFVLGRLAEANALLVDLESGSQPQNAEFSGLAERMRAKLAFAAGDHAQAVLHADAALVALDDAEFATLRARLRLLRQRALLASDRRAVVGDALPGKAGAVTITEQLPATLVAAAELAAADGRGDPADATFRAALARANALGVAEDIIIATSAYGRWLLAHGRNDAAAAVIGRTSTWADRDFRCALLETELHHASGHSGAWSHALEKALRLAGEREVAAALRTPPTG